MIVDLMQFWLFSGFLLAGAAWSIDTLLRDRGVQLRGVWAGAIGLTVLSPVLPRIGTFGSSGEVAPTGSNPLPLPVDAGAASVADLALLPLQGLLSNGTVLTAWAFLSVFCLWAGAAVLYRLRARVRTWRSTRISGEDVLVAPDFGPAVVGIVDPSVVLPEGLMRAPATDLDLILRHEREHIDARDPWLLLAGAAVVALMPWNVPLVWQVMRLRGAVEEDCDIRVLRSGACRQQYGDLLVRMASRSSGFGFAAAAMSERHSGLRRRLERLRNRRGQTRVAVMALLVIAGAGAIGVWMGLPSPVALFHGHGHGHASAPLVPSAPPVPDAPQSPQPPIPPARAPLSPDGRAPLIYIDGEKFDGEVTDLDPNTIERIEVLKGAAALGVNSRAENGLVKIYLKASGGGSGSNR